MAGYTISRISFLPVFGSGPQAFFAAGFFAAGFLAAGFFAVVFFAAGFLTAFFAAGFLAAGFFAAGFLAAGFFAAGFLTAGFLAFFSATLPTLEHSIIMNSSKVNIIALRAVCSRSISADNKKIKSFFTKDKNFS
ncbi:MAG: hypothetical protein LBT68_04360 [Spirochaetales bacterium]|nr:hypothetical protein [Spirochaetales bacterium]